MCLLHFHPNASRACFALCKQQHDVRHVESGICSCERGNEQVDARIQLDAVSRENCDNCTLASSSRSFSLPVLSSIDPSVSCSFKVLISCPFFPHAQPAKTVNGGSILDVGGKCLSTSSLKTLSNTRAAATGASVRKIDTES